MKLNLNVAENKIVSSIIERPNRLIIDIMGENKNNHVKKLNTPYISHKKYRLKGPILINVLDIDLNNNSIELTPAMANTNSVFGKKSVNHIMRNNEAIAGINASFFKPPTGLPLGTLIINGEYITGPIYNRVALVIDDSNTARLEKIQLNSGFVTKDGNYYPIHNINQPRMSTKGYMLYTDKWTAPVARTLKNERRIAVLHNVVIDTTTDSIHVPENGFVITGPNKDEFKSIRVGDSLKVIIKPAQYPYNIKHAIGGGPLLLKNGKVFIDMAQQKFVSAYNVRNPRTAIGITKNNHIYLVTVDGRNRGSIGMTFNQLANFMKSIGAYDAMNFDGGSSTQMLYNNKMVNTPTVRGGASISTAIVIKKTPGYIIVNKESGIKTDPM